MYEDAISDAQGNRTVRASYDPDERESLAVTIAEAVARAEGVPADELGSRMFDAIDPEALEQLFGPTDSRTFEAEASFRMAGYTVVVRNTGEIFVSRRS